MCVNVVDEKCANVVDEKCANDEKWSRDPMITAQCFVPTFLH